jgi:hypothetical protein
MKAIGEFLIEHWVLTLSPVVWALIRIIPTKKNYDLVAGIVKIIDLLIPNLKKGGGTFKMIALLLLINFSASAQNQFKWIRLTNINPSDTANILNNGAIFYNPVSNKFRFRQNDVTLSLGGVTASNGIAIESDVVKLGTSGFTDAVITGTRHVTIGNGTATASSLRFNTNPSFSGATIQIVGHTGTVGITDGTDVLSFIGNATMNNRRVTFTDAKTPGSRTGMQYGGDYSADLISQPRSFPDVGMMLGAKTYTDGATQTMNPNGTTSGLNVGSHTADPSSLQNGDLWYESTSGNLRARIGGTSVSLGTGNISGTVSAGRVTYGTGANTVGDEAGFEYNATTNRMIAATLSASGEPTTAQLGDYYLGAGGIVSIASNSGELSLVNGSKVAQWSFSANNLSLLTSGPSAFNIASIATSLPKAIHISAGNSTSGNNNGGDLALTPGLRNGSGSSGDFVLTIQPSTGGYFIITGPAGAAGLPTSSAGLPSGAVWNNAGVLNIVP